MACVLVLAAMLLAVAYAGHLAGGARSLAGAGLLVLTMPVLPVGTLLMLAAFVVCYAERLRVGSQVPLAFDRSSWLTLALAASVVFALIKDWADTAPWGLLPGNFVILCWALLALVVVRALRAVPSLWREAVGDPGSDRSRVLKAKLSAQTNPACFRRDWAGFPFPRPVTALDPQDGLLQTWPGGTRGRKAFRSYILIIASFLVTGAWAYSVFDVVFSMSHNPAPVVGGHQGDLMLGTSVAFFSGALILLDVFCCRTDGPPPRSKLLLLLVAVVGLANLLAVGDVLLAVAGARNPLSREFILGIYRAIQLVGITTVIVIILKNARVCVRWVNEKVAHRSGRPSRGA